MRKNTNWQIGSIFIAKLQVYRVRRPRNNCHQIALKCTKSHTCIEFQKLYEDEAPDPRRLEGWKLCPQTPVPNWESDKVATLASTSATVRRNAADITANAICRYGKMSGVIGVVWSGAIDSNRLLHGGLGDGIPPTGSRAEPCQRVPQKLKRFMN